MYLYLAFYYCRYQTTLIIGRLHSLHLCANCVCMCVVCAVGQPMQMQPVVQWMAPPAPVPGIPPGLEYLTQIDQLLVHQQIEIMESKL